MKKSKLINYTTQDFVSEKELELKLFRWNNIKDKYLSKLKANGVLRIVTTKVWNKEGISRLGHLFEYEDDKAYQKCQPIFQEIERNEKKDQLIKVFGNRGVVLEEYDFRND
jgi:membrane-bound lytic murein transglycosylase MltF